MSIDFDEHGYQKVSHNDFFRHDCSGCGDCCRNIKDSVMVESLDLYRLALFFGVEMSDIILQYTDTAFLAWGFPVFMLKTQPQMDACVFLNGSRCSVQEAKPRTCRLYPLGTGPDDKKQGALLSFIVSKKQHHFKGKRHRVRDWINTNLSPEDRAFIFAEYNSAGELARLIKNIDRQYEGQVLEMMMFYKYVAFDMAEPFQPQYTRNMEQLKKRLNSLGGG